MIRFRIDYKIVGINVYDVYEISFTINIIKLLKSINRYLYTKNSKVNQLKTKYKILKQNIKTKNK